MEKLYLFYDPTLDQAYESKDDESIFITAKDLSPLTIDLCGILLPLLPTTLINYNNINQNATKDDNSLVLTHTTRKHLHTIALGLSMKMPILLEGACGVGKTSLVEEAARTFGNRGIFIFSCTFTYSLKNCSKFIWVIKPTVKFFSEPTYPHLHLDPLDGNPVY